MVSWCGREAEGLAAAPARRRGGVSMETSRPVTVTEIRNDPALRAQIRRMQQDVINLAPGSLAKAVGNVVHLKSGSPDLTVIAVGSDHKNVAVEWHDGGKGCYALFPSVCVN